MFVRWVLGLTLVLEFLEDSATAYAGWWGAPFGWVHPLLMESLPVGVRAFELITALCLVLALRSTYGKGPRVKPMRNALILSGATLVFWLLYGMFRHGWPYMAGFQMYLPLSGIFFAFAVAAVFRTPDHYALLAKMLFVVAAYRAAMCWIFYFFYVRGMPTGWGEGGFYITDHDDTVLWVVCMIVLALRILEIPGVARRVKDLLFFLFLFGAVVFNDRRIAWVSLATGLVVMLVLMPSGKIKRRAKRALWAFAPVLLIYVVVGWGRSSKIFAPLKSFATVSTQEDGSTKARNMENLNLIATSNAGGLLMGTGWGHPFLTVSYTYNLDSVFKWWRYFPHNSVLGMLSFTGVLGFFGYWLAFPTAMFLNARTARYTTNPLARQVATIGAVNLVVVANQYYGDIGFGSVKAVYMLSLSYALALRMPILAGAWPGPKLQPKAGTKLA